MIEVEPGTVERLGQVGATGNVPEGVGFGECALVGEIVDSKCYPRRHKSRMLKPHRACAILCLRGDARRFWSSAQPLRWRVITGWWDRIEQP